MKKEISTIKAPSAIGPYSQAILASGESVYVSGQLGINPINSEMASDIVGQTTQALENMQAILNEVGLSLDNVVKTTVMLSDIANFALMNEVYAKFFTNVTPARSAFEVAALPKNALVEIEAIAIK